MSIVRSILAAALIALVTGCASSSTDYRPFSEYEKRLLVRGIQGHAMDVITTQVSLNNDDIIESNPIVQHFVVDKEVEFMAIKAAMICSSYLSAQAIADPVWRQRVLRANIVAGWTPALWNIGVMGTF